MTEPKQEKRNCPAHGDYLYPRWTRCELCPAPAVAVQSPTPPVPQDDDAPPWPIDREDYHDALRYLIKDLAERNAAIDRIMAAPASPVPPAPAEAMADQWCPNCEYLMEDKPDKVTAPTALVDAVKVALEWYDGRCPEVISEMEALRDATEGVTTPAPVEAEKLVNAYTIAVVKLERETRADTSFGVNMAGVVTAGHARDEARAALLAEFTRLSMEKALALESAVSCLAATSPAPLSPSDGPGEARSSLFKPMHGGKTCWNCDHKQHQHGADLRCPASEGVKAPASPVPPAPDLRENLAALCHYQWSGWMRYLFGKCEILPNGDKGDLAVIPEWAVQRWKRQMETVYDSLSNAEKDSDRAEADRFLALLAPAPQPIPPPLTWTKEKPKVEGMYWTRLQPGEVEIASVEEYNHGSLIAFYANGRSRAVSVANPSREWAGPIAEPQAQPIPPEAGA